MQISKVIRQYGYTIEEVALKMGLKSGGSLRYILSRKNGKDAMPSLTTLRKIADAVGCSVGEFFDDERNSLREYNGTQPVLDIRHVMQVKNLRNKDLADKLGISEQNLCALLAKDNVTISRLYKVAEALEVSITDFFQYHDKESRPE